MKQTPLSPHLPFALLKQLVLCLDILNKNPSAILEDKAFSEIFRNSQCTKVYALMNNTVHEGAFLQRGQGGEG